MGLLILVVFWRVEQKVTNALVDLSLVLRGGLGLPLIMGFLLGAELFGAQTPSVVFMGLQPGSAGFGVGLSSGPLGLTLLCFGVAAFAGTVIAPRLAERFGSRRTIVIGSILTGAPYVMMAISHAAVGPFVTWQAIAGLGNGLLLAAVFAVAVARSPTDSIGIASGLYNTSRTAAGAVSGAAFTALMATMAIMAIMATSIPGADDN